MNSINLIGNITRTPETGVTKSEKNYCKFGIAVNRAFAKDETDFINCVAWGKTAELIAKYCDKGSKVGVTGRLQTGSYEKDGKRVYTADVVVEQVMFLTKKSEDAQAEEFTEDAENMDDIPF